MLYSMSLLRSNVRLTRLLLRCSYSTTTASNPATTPSVLVKIRNDMKDAMKAKDSSRCVANGAYPRDLF